MLRLLKADATPYLVGAACAAAATLARLALSPWLGEGFPFITYFPALIVAAYLGGLRPALVTLALSTALAVAFVMGRSAGAEEGRVGLGLFAFVGLVMAWMGGAMKAGRRAESALAASEERHRCLSELTLDFAVSARVDAGGGGALDSATPGFAKVTGYAPEALRTAKDWAALFHPDDRAAVRQAWDRLTTEGAAEGEFRVVTPGGATRWLRCLGRGVVGPGLGRVVRVHIAAQDLTERKQAQVTIEEQVRLAEFGRDVGLALTDSADLKQMLERCAEVAVRHLRGAFARIWTLDESGETLVLQASAGLYTHLDGPHSRVPVGRFKIGQIARDRKPHLTNAVIGDPKVGEQEWALREGMSAFAGYPLVVEDRVVGVMAMFARQELSPATLRMMASVANEIANGIERKRGEERLARQREWLQVTLASVGDAVIATDTDGRVAFLNAVAERLTGWPAAEAEGRPLEEVFRIVNESTREPVANPAVRALREGAVVGLANHTLLVARDGSECAIDDSAAPIRDDEGHVLGAVLIFRDVEARRLSERALEASEARKAAVLKSALDAIVTINHDGLVVEWNPAAEHTFGYTRSEALGLEMASLIVPPALREAHRRGLARFLATGEGPILNRRIEIVACRADGVEFPIELAVTPIETGGTPIFTAHARDISARKAVEHRRNVRLAVAQVLAAAGPGEAMPRILQALCEGLGWSLGALWCLDETDAALRCHDLWHAPSDALARFAADHRGRALARGEGLPGRSWMTGGPAWAAVGGAGPDAFPIARAGAEAGLRGALAVPVTAGDRFLGAVEFFSAAAREPDDDLMELVVTLGGQIGLLLERGRAEGERRRLNAIIEHSPDFIGLAGADQGVLFVNRAGRRLVGLGDAAPVNGLSVLDFFPDDERARVVREALPVLADSGHWDGEVFFRNFANGAGVPVLWNVFTIPDPQTGRNFFACVSRDVTESRRVEARLRQSENRYRTLIEVSPQIVWEASADGAVTYCNPHWVEYSGLSAEESAGEGWTRAVHPEHRANVRDAWFEAAARGAAVRIEAPFRRAADGHYRWHLARAMPLKDDAGRVVRRVAVAVDIDEIKAVEHRLGFLAEAGTILASSLDYRETLKNIVGLAAGAFADFCFFDLVLDDGRVERVVWAHADAASRPALDDLARHALPSWFEGHPVVRALATGTTQFAPRVDDQWMRRASLSPDHYRAMKALAPASVVTVPVPSHDRTVGALTFARTGPSRPFDALDVRLAEDLGRRAGVSLHNARLYQEAEQANQAKTQFLAVLSHELRTPLNPILLAASALLERPDDPEQLRPTLEMIRQNVNLQARLIDDLLDVMRIVRGKMPLHWEVVDCHAVVLRAVEVCQADVKEKGLALAVELGAGHRHVNADPARLQQVFWNLIKNAVKFTPAGGTITVRTCEEVEPGDPDGRIVVTVSDTGIGIAGDMLARIFDPFQQAETTITRKYGGLGLGLAICRGIVEAHGGGLAVESPGLGQGTTFRVALKALPEPAGDGPAGAEDEARHADPAADGRGAQPLRILVVEDEPATLRLMGRLLRGLGHEVTTADGIAPALEQFDAGAFDLIVSDIGLPDGSGLDLMRQVTARGRGPVPAIALTGYGMEEDVRRSREAGFATHLTKPIDFKKLEAMIRRVAPRRF